MGDSFINIILTGSYLLAASLFLKWKVRSPTGLEDGEGGVKDLMKWKMV